MMKWWGWGDPKMSFPMDNKPGLWPWIRDKVGLTDERKSPPVERNRIQLNKPHLNANFCNELEKIIRSDQILSDDEERLLHAYGKSYPDLLRVRRGEVEQAPDLVLLPETHDDVEKIVAAAHTHNICLIPFGGGTNIVGGVNPLEKTKRMIVTLDMRRMNRILSIDHYSMTATIQVGILGPKLEKDLQSHNLSLGHYPDSFEYSTLGGWLATRSAGMQSDAYGKIEDMVVSLRLVTPSGTIQTRPVPASSAGPDLNQVVVGSEGVLGVITEATMKVHSNPEVKDYRGYLFPTFEDGVNAIYECVQKGIPPSMIRLQDSGETELAMNMKARKKGLPALIQMPVKNYLTMKGYTSPCIMIIGFEGDSKTVKYSGMEAFRILRRHKGFPLGKSVGKTWYVDKFNVPYLRDFVMDFGCMVDVSETSALWSNVIPLYRNVISAVKEKFNSEYGKGYVGCHISHTYSTGVCLYFTYAAKQIPGDELKQYYDYKKTITDTIMKSGGTLSHHHAVGYEHIQWMKEELSPTGIQTLHAIKSSLDPKGIFNPGKLIPNQ
jgi:alkyldihydroxyacetonephosphate synthase